MNQDMDEEEFHASQFEKIKAINYKLKDTYNVKLKIKKNTVLKTLKTLNEDAEIYELCPKRLIDKLNEKLETLKMMESENDRKINELLQQKYELQDSIQDICCEYDKHKYGYVRSTPKTDEVFEYGYDTNALISYCLCCDLIFNANEICYFSEYFTFTDEDYMKN